MKTLIAIALTTLTVAPGSLDSQPADQPVVTDPRLCTVTTAGELGGILPPNAVLDDAAVEALSSPVPGCHWYEAPADVAW